MRSWPMPFLPELPGSAPAVQVRDVASGELVDAAAGPEVLLYVCGITPYDATHMGHAATYVTFDVLNRILRDAGSTVRYVQNITDIDDPLLERAERDGVDWRELATREIALFREDMTALQVIPPDEYLGAVESIPTFVAPIEAMVAKDIAYSVPVEPDASPAPVSGDAVDWYFDVSKDPSFGEVSGLDAETMIDVSRENGGDPDRDGKRNRVDPLLWRAERVGEPAWDGGSLGRGRPGWHIECACLALDHLGPTIDIQGGGSDLAFPHHEMSTAHAQAITGEAPFARAYVHQGMVGYQGEKMSKSKGNLVRVSDLRAAGVDPMQIRLALLAHAHGDDWEWTDADLTEAATRLEMWRSALSGNGGPDAEETLSGIRAALADGLDTTTALRHVDEWARRAAVAAADPDAALVEGAPGVLARALDALLGVRI